MSTGPGDPELLTIKAKRILEECGVIAYPVRAAGERSTAFDIVRKAVDVSEKQVSELIFSMSSDKAVRSSDYSNAVTMLTNALDNGDDICMITLGDVSVYSTFMRIGKDIENRGYELEIVPGVPSFCDGAARAKIPLMIGTEGLAVVSASEGSELFTAALEGFDNVVIMKARDVIERISDEVENLGCASDAVVISNAGMADQYIGPLDKNRRYGYFTTVIVKKRREGGK